jgi:hypothetical protein
MKLTKYLLAFLILVYGNTIFAQGKINDQILEAINETAHYAADILLDEEGNHAVIII